MTAMQLRVAGQTSTSTLCMFCDNSGGEIVFQKANSGGKPVVAGGKRRKRELRLLRNSLGVKIGGGSFATRLGDAARQEEFLYLRITFDEGVLLRS